MRGYGFRESVCGRVRFSILGVMRVVLVNWARVWDGPRVGGGVNGYGQAVALRLMDLGHDVVWLCGGSQYRRGGECEVRRHPDWLGIRVLEVVNSPVLAPSICQFRRPMEEVRSPELEAKVGELFGRLRADVVHFHNIEGFSIGCVDAAREAGARVVYSLHNYHTVCPQVYLLKGHRVACRDFDGGRACVGCIEAPDPDEERARRERAATRQREAGQGSRGSLIAELRAFIAGRGGDEAEDRPLPPPGVPIDSCDLDAPLAYPREEDRGQSRLVMAERQPVRGAWDDAPEFAPIENDATPDPIGESPNEYGERRRAMIGMLNRCDLVLAVSEFVREKFVALGVDAGVIRTMHIGTRMVDLVERHRELVFDPPAFDAARPRAVRMVFMGVNHWYKGLPMLADSLERLPPEVLREIDLSIHAMDGGSIEWRFRRLEPRLARLKFSLAYEPQDVPWICGGKDLGIVPSVWWDNGPQTVLEFQACGLPVLGARLGGIPDFVQDGVNGLLFRGNDRADLARRIGEIVREPQRLEALRRNVRKPKSMAEHAEELVEAYTGLVAAGRGAFAGH